MRKFILLIILSLIATSAFALVETANNGPINVTWCWIKGAPTIEKGDLVALVTGASVTFPGREVTGTDSDLGLTQIYGVYLGDTVTSSTTAMTNGVFIPVQTHGYVATVVLDGVSTSANQNRAGNTIFAGSTTYEGTLGSAGGVGIAFSSSTTGNVMAFSEPASGSGTVSGWISGL